MNPDPRDDDIDDNPYRPTAEVADRLIVGRIELPLGITGTMVRQVQIVGILMIVQGSLDVTMSIFVGIYAWLMPEILREAATNNPGGRPMPPETELVISMVGSGLAVAVLAVGLANIFGGIWAIQFRHRGRILIALWSGMATLLTCYCLPTSAMLLVYGMIVLLSQSTALAFDLRRRGHDVAEIQQAFLVASSRQ